MSDQKRPYRMRRRAELEEETRRRITQSTMALHEQLGPAHTTISAIAALAGVRRSTVYRHFPDDEALYAACTAHWCAAHPPPDPAAWARIDNPGRRTQIALGELYPYYRSTQAMYTSLLRDEPHVAIVRRNLRDFSAYLEAARRVLEAGRTSTPELPAAAHAALGHALAFPTWRSLALDHGLTDEAAAELMSLLVECTTTGRPTRSR